MRATPRNPAAAAGHSKAARTDAATALGALLSIGRAGPTPASHRSGARTRMDSMCERLAAPPAGHISTSELRVWITRVCGNRRANVSDLNEEAAHACSRGVESALSCGESVAGAVAYKQAFTTLGLHLLARRFSPMERRIRRTAFQLQISVLR
jgi:hypothetical protein